MDSTKKPVIQHSIQDYLKLTDQSWVVEFEIFDFGASLTSFLELPPIIYAMNPKAHFWAFMRSFLMNCEIGFIQRPIRASSDDYIEMALVGWCNKEQVAIPLWILHERLLGFEVISFPEFDILDSLPLNWITKTLPDQSDQLFIPTTREEIMFQDDIFMKHKLFLRIVKKNIFLSTEIDEHEFFQRIAETDIPELDDF